MFSDWGGSGSAVTITLARNGFDFSQSFKRTAVTSSSWIGLPVLLDFKGTRTWWWNHLLNIPVSLFKITFFFSLWNLLLFFYHPSVRPSTELNRALFHLDQSRLLVVISEPSVSQNDGDLPEYNVDGKMVILLTGTSGFFSLEPEGPSCRVRAGRDTSNRICRTHRKRPSCERNINVISTLHITRTKSQCNCH